MLVSWEPKKSLYFSSNDLRTRNYNVDKKNGTENFNKMVRNHI